MRFYTASYRFYLPMCVFFRGSGEEGGAKRGRSREEKKKEVGIARIYLNFIAGRVSHGTEVGVI